MHSHSTRAPKRHTRRVALAFALLAAGAAGQAFANVTFYEGEGFRGAAFETNRPIANLARTGFNDRAASVIVSDGRWEVCDDADFRGRCAVLRPGNYDSLGRMGLGDRISSVRPIDSRHQYEQTGPEPLPTAYEYRRRPQERLFNAPVTSVHAVVGPPEQHCWVSREQVPAPNVNVGGALAGALIGGVIGHQIGGGTGREVATVGGAVVGGAIGANAGRDGRVAERDVQHCEGAPAGPPEYWDVTYDFQGVTHRIQMGSPPGQFIVVNDTGEPRQ